MSSPAEEEARRRERRAAVRAHHPDAGGDAARLQAELRAIDERYAARPDRRAEPPEASGTGAFGDHPLPAVLRAGVRAGVRLGVRAVRERIPAGWPGHRRMIDVTDLTDHRRRPPR